MGTEKQPLLSTSPPVTTMMALLPLLSLATAVLAAPPMADYGSDYGSEVEDFANLTDYGSDYGSGDYGSGDYGSEAEDFDNLTMSSAAEERAINTCNCASVSSSDRIVGGKEVNPKYKLPYQVLVSPCNKQGNCFMCGGTILNKRYVVTAAHCLYAGKDLMTLKGGSQFRVMLGEHDHCKATSSFVLASAVHKHPKFDINSASVDNDIAILKLSKDLTFSDKIKPVCLPTSATKDYSGKASTVSGWGGTKAYTPMAPVDQPRQCALKEAIVDILKPSSTKCSNFLGDSSSTTRLCAWGKGKDACQGDSGGPLTVAENGKYVLLGVVSYGSGCATENPGVYARVQGFLPWMKKIIADGECSSSSGAAATTASSATTAAATTTTAPAATTGQDYGNYGNYGDYNYEG